MDIRGIICADCPSPMKCVRAVYFNRPLFFLKGTIMSKAYGFTVYVGFAILVIFLTLLAWILSPFLALYSVKKNVSKLPGIWQWFSTADDDLDGGIHQGEYPDYSEWAPWVVWIYRTRWICRNPAQGFSYYLFGARHLTEEHPTFVYDHQDIKDGVTSGYYCHNMGRLFGCPIRYFSFRGKWWFCKYVGIRYNFGWKLTRHDKYKMLVISVTLRFNFGK